MEITYEVSKNAGGVATFAANDSKLKNMEK